MRSPRKGTRRRHSTSHNITQFFSPAVSITTRGGAACQCRQTKAVDHGLARAPLRRLTKPVPRSSIRQFETVAFWSFLAARRLRWIRLALAAHARKDDDLRARRLRAVARLRTRVPRTEVKNHSHCVPLAVAMRAPASPSQSRPPNFRGESSYLTATGVNGLLILAMGIALWDQSISHLFAISRRLRLPLAVRFPFRSSR